MGMLFTISIDMIEVSKGNTFFSKCLPVPEKLPNLPQRPMNLRLMKQIRLILACFVLLLSGTGPGTRARPGSGPGVG
jgi:hypothetical protein